MALLTALGVDNFGSGLFLPLALVYVTRVVGLPLGTAGALVSAGTLAGLAVPPAAGRLVDRVGPKPVVIAAQLLQALGAVTYLLARAGPAVLAAAVLLAAGQQAFYSSLVALIGDAAGDGPHDRPFVIANMVRSACFGLGGLVVAGVLTAAGLVALRLAVAVDAATFVACALLLALFVRLPRRAHRHPGRELARPAVLADRLFVALIVLTGLVMLPGDFFLAGTPVYVLEVLHAPPWLPGTMLALETALISVAGIAVLRATGRLSRLSAMRLGAGLYVLSCAVGFSASLVPPGWRPAGLLLAAVVLAAASLVFTPRAIALAEAAAPSPARGRFLAAYQYAFTAAQVLAPAVVALYSAALWLPWLVVASSAAAASAGFRLLASRVGRRLRSRPDGSRIGRGPNSAGRRTGPAALSHTSRA